jgi:hypothetical protein
MQGGSAPPILPAVDTGRAAALFRSAAAEKLGVPALARRTQSPQASVTGGATRRLLTGCSRRRIHGSLHALFLQFLYV